MEVAMEPVDPSKKTPKSNIWETISTKKAQLERSVGNMMGKETKKPESKVKADPDKSGPQTERLSGAWKGWTENKLHEPPEKSISPRVLGAMSTPDSKAPTAKPDIPKKSAPDSRRNAIEETDPNRFAREAHSERLEKHKQEFLTDEKLSSRQTQTLLTGFTNAIKGRENEFINFVSLNKQTKDIQISKAVVDVNGAGFDDDTKGNVVKYIREFLIYEESKGDEYINAKRLLEEELRQTEGSSDSNEVSPDQTKIMANNARIFFEKQDEADKYILCGRETAFRQYLNDYYGLKDINAEHQLQLCKEISLNLGGFPDKALIRAQRFINEFMEVGPGYNKKDLSKLPSETLRELLKNKEDAFIIYLDKQNVPSSQYRSYLIVLEEGGLVGGKEQMERARAAAISFLTSGLNLQ
jgi:hypothetical protein